MKTGIKDVFLGIEKFCNHQILYPGGSMIEMFMSMWVLIFLLLTTLFTMPAWLIPYLIIKYIRYRKEAHDDT